MWRLRLSSFKDEISGLSVNSLKLLHIIYFSLPLNFIHEMLHWRSCLTKAPCFKVFSICTLMLRYLFISFREIEYNYITRGYTWKKIPYCFSWHVCENIIDKSGIPLNSHNNIYSAIVSKQLTIILFDGRAHWLINANNVFIMDIRGLSQKSVTS